MELLLLLLCLKVNNWNKNWFCFLIHYVCFVFFYYWYNGFAFAVRFGAASFSDFRFSVFDFRFPILSSDSEFVSDSIAWLWSILIKWLLYRLCGYEYKSVLKKRFCVYLCVWASCLKLIAVAISIYLWLFKFCSKSSTIV